MSARGETGLRAALLATGLYHLPGDTPLDGELKAYGAGFQMVEEAFDRLLGDLFLDTASQERLADWELLVRSQPALGGPEDLRETLMQRFSVRPGPCTRESLSAMLPAAGIRGVVKEKDGALCVAVGRFLGVSEEEAVRELELVLPAHLEWELQKTACWVARDARQMDFLEWDAQGMDWVARDAVTWEELQN